MLIIIEISHRLDAHFVYIKSVHGDHMPKLEIDAESKQSQSDKFKTMAKEVEAKDDEKALNKAIGKISQAKPKKS